MSKQREFFRDLLEALDEMPVKELISEAWSNHHGVCAVGALCHARGIGLGDLTEDAVVASALGTKVQVLCKVTDENDWPHENETPGARWQRVRNWVASNVGAAP